MCLRKLSALFCLENPRNQKRDEKETLAVVLIYIYCAIDRKMLIWNFPGDFAVNFGECLMTRIQRMSLDYHFKVEQEAGSCTFAFFGFNGRLFIVLSMPHRDTKIETHLTNLWIIGTAGVWRISALNEAGGWEDRTTVEDMDLAVRAILKGWKFLYVGDVKVSSFLINIPAEWKIHRNMRTFIPFYSMWLNEVS